MVLVHEDWEQALAKVPIVAWEKVLALELVVVLKGGPWVIFVCVLDLIVVILTYSNIVFILLLVCSTARWTCHYNLANLRWLDRNVWSWGHSKRVTGRSSLVYSYSGVWAHSCTSLLFFGVLSIEVSEQVCRPLCLSCVKVAGTPWGLINGQSDYHENDKRWIKAHTVNDDDSHHVIVLVVVAPMVDKIDIEQWKGYKPDKECESLQSSQESIEIALFICTGDNLDEFNQGKKHKCSV